MAKQVKSKQRVADHGEVFTAEREVKAMCDLVADDCLRTDSRFLEPACGDGNFLNEILTRKLDPLVKKYKRDSYMYEKESLLALGSIYGVDIMMDNVIECRERLFKLWEEKYKKAVKKADRNEEVLDSAKYILSLNIICGDALNLHCVDETGKDNGIPIIFSQWALATGPMMKREDYSFEDLLGKENAPAKNEPEQMSLELNIDSEENDEGTLIKVYPPIHYRRLSEYGRE